MRDSIVGRPIKVDGMAYAPTNEQGVVFLFGKLASRLERVMHFGLGMIDSGHGKAKIPE